MKNETSFGERLIRIAQGNITLQDACDLHSEGFTITLKNNQIIYGEEADDR